MLQLIFWPLCKNVLNDWSSLTISCSTFPTDIDNQTSAKLVDFEQSWGMEFVDLSAIILLSPKTLSAQIFLLRLLEKIVIINPLLSPLFRRLLEIRKNLVVKRKKIVTTTGIFYRQNFDYRFKKLSVFSGYMRLSSSIRWWKILR